MTDQPSKDEILAAIKAGVHDAMPYPSQILDAIFDATRQSLTRDES